MTGTYSIANYQQYQEKKDKNIFEEIIDSLMLENYSDNEEVTDYINSLSNDDRRVAILSLLDGDNNLWIKLKSLIKNNELTKMEHIKDVVHMLREYVKVGEVEKKKFGEVMTSLDLIKEVIKPLPKEVWSNPDLKWLDPANGTGPFPIMVIYRLMLGLEEWQPDANLRYKHIVENMIYTCELQARNVFLWLCAVDPHDEYETNTYWGSFLGEGFDNHMKDVWGLKSLESFDIVLGNPPYQKGKDSNFYVKFIEKFYKISKKGAYLIFIVPNRFFHPSHKAHKSIINYDINIVHHNLNRYFPNISTHIGSFLLKKENSPNSNKEVLCKFDSGEVVVDLNTPIPTDIKMSDIAYKKILDKIIKGENINLSKLNGDLYIKRQWKRWNSVTGIGGDHVFNCVLDYDPQRDGKDGRWIKCSDIKKMEWYLSKSNIIRFLTKLFASAMNVPPFVWNIIPNIDLDKINNNEQLYEYFNLTEEEINLIETTIK